MEPKCTGPLLERLRLKSPETLSAYSSGRCGSALKLPWSELTVVNNLWQLLFYKLTNCSNSTSVQHYELLNFQYFSGILKHLKLSKLNSAFNHFLFFVFPTKFTIQTKEEELYICFMIEIIIMIIIKKTQKWESKGSPGIEKFLLTSLVSMFLRVSKWPWAIIFYKNRFQS